MFLIHGIITIMVLDIKSLIGEATAYDKKLMLEKNGLKAGLKVCLLLLMVKVEQLYLE